MDKAFVAELHRRKREGHTYAPLRVQRKTKPKNWDRVRVFPGVYGRCIGEMDAKHWYLIDVPLDALLDYAGSLPSSSATETK